MPSRCTCNWLVPKESWMLKLEELITNTVYQAFYLYMAFLSHFEGYWQSSDFVASRRKRTYIVVHFWTCTRLQFSYSEPSFYLPGWYRLDLRAFIQWDCDVYSVHCGGRFCDTLFPPILRRQLLYERGIRKNNFWTSRLYLLDPCVLCIRMDTYKLIKRRVYGSAT